MISGTEALSLLRAGNARFVKGRLEGGDQVVTRREELTDGQTPFAIVLGCADSRVPAELVFDVGLGDLFVVRVAGNIAAPSQLGSLEFAASLFGTRLVVVLGHTACGAIKATIEGAPTPVGASPNLGEIARRIGPAIQDEIAAGDADGTLVDRAVRANVEATVAGLRKNSEILDDLARSDGLVIVGAVYSLESGAVEFLDPA